MSSSKRSTAGRVLAKGLGIKIPYRDPLGSGADPITRGESVFSTGTAETYIEPEPTVIGYLHEQLPNGRDIGHYILSLFPFLSWITRYNWQWFIGDLIAGKSILFLKLENPHTVLTLLRYYRRCRCCSPGNVICSTG